MVHVVRPAEIQPRLDRGVRVRGEPVRCQPGPFDGCAGERHHQVGYQLDGRDLLRLLPRRQLHRGGFIQHRVLPYQNQQFSATFGGPIRRDRIHFFTNFEWEREPETSADSSPYPSFNFDQESTRTEKKGGVRLDFQFTPQTRDVPRATGAASCCRSIPNRGATGTLHRHRGWPAERHHREPDAGDWQSRALNEIKVEQHTESLNTERSSTGPATRRGRTGCPKAPIIMLRGYTIGQAHNSRIRTTTEYGPAFVTTSPIRSSRAGATICERAESIYRTHHVLGIAPPGRARRDRRPGAGQHRALFPVWNDPSTWNLAALSPITRWYRRGSGSSTSSRSKTVCGLGAGRLGDPNRLTLNLGIRYDVIKGTYAEDVEVDPFLEAGRPIDTNNIQPRLGFAYRVNDRTVVRGGFGEDFGETGFSQAHWTNLWAGQVHPDISPMAGRTLRRIRSTDRRPPTLDLELGSCSSQPRSFAAPDAQVPYSYQSSIGVQRQIGSVMAVDADYIFVAPTSARDVSARREPGLQPGDRVQLPFSDRTRRLPVPGVGFGGDAKPDRSG